MSNEEIVNKRNQAIKDANGVYNQIINEQTDLINNQGNQIDDYMKSSKDTINQDINKNVSELQNISEQAKREQEAEKQAIMKNYTNYTNNVDETTRIGALNSVRNRMNESDASLQDVIQEYNNQIAQAKITGQSIIAQNALEMLKEKVNLYTTGVDMNNNMSIANNNNKLQLTKDYASLDSKYSSANNDYLDRQNEINQFNTEMKYKNQQLNEQKKLKEKEYQLALSEARKSYYSSRSRRSGSSSGGYALSNTSSNGNTLSNTSKSSNNSGANTKYYANYSAKSLSEKGRQVSNKLASMVAKNGYITQKELISAVSGLSKDDQGKILATFKVGTTKPHTKKNTTTKGYTTKQTSSKKTNSVKSTKKENKYSSFKTFFK